MNVYPYRLTMSSVAAILAASVGWQVTICAPRRRVGPIFASGALSGTTTVAGIPSSAAAYARACAWLPLEWATTPRWRTCPGSALIAE